MREFHKISLKILLLQNIGCPTLKWNKKRFKLKDLTEEPHFYATFLPFKNSLIVTRNFKEMNFVILNIVQTSRLPNFLINMLSYASSSRFKLSITKFNRFNDIVFKTFVNSYSRQKINLHTGKRTSAHWQLLQHKLLAINGRNVE